MEVGGQLLWSPEVRLGLSICLVPFGVLWIYKALRNQQGQLLPLALLPLCFSVLQLADGALLLQLRLSANDKSPQDEAFETTVGTVSTFILLVFVPFWSCFAAWCLELRRANSMFFGLYALALFAALSELVAQPLLDASSNEVLTTSLFTTTTTTTMMGEAFASAEYPALRHDYLGLPALKSGLLPHGLFKLAIVVLPTLPAMVSAAPHVQLLRMFLVLHSAAAFVSFAVTQEALLSGWGFFSAWALLLLTPSFRALKPDQ